MTVRPIGRWMPRRARVAALGLAALSLTVHDWSDTAPSTTTAASDARTSQSSVDDATSTLWLANVDPDLGANVTIDLVREDGTSTQPLTWPGLAPFASTRRSLGAEPAVGGGRHAATVRWSGGRLGLVTYEDGPWWGVAAANAVEAASSDLVLGYWVRSYIDQSGLVTLFNPGSKAADDIAIEWYMDRDPGAPVVTTRLALAPGAVRTIDIASPAEGVAVGDGTRGWARVRSSVPLAVQGTLAQTGGSMISASVEAVPAASAARRWHVPLMYWSWSDRVSMPIESFTYVVNPGNTTVQVTQTLQGLTEDCRGVRQVNPPSEIPARGAALFSAYPLPGRCAGSGRFDATGDVIVTALVNEQHGVVRSIGLYAPQPLAEAVAHAVLPARRAVGPTRRTTEFHVLNPGPAAMNAALTLRNADGTISPCGAACAFALSGDSAVRFDLAEMSAVPEGFDGSVWIDGDGPLHAAAYERNAAFPADGAVFRAVDARRRMGDDRSPLSPRVVRAVTPVPTPTETPTESPTETVEPPTRPATRTPSASDTPWSVPAPSIVPVPTAYTATGPSLQADIVDLIASGARRRRMRLAVDGDHVVRLQEGRFDAFELGDDEPRHLGTLLLASPLPEWVGLFVSGTAAALVHDGVVRFIDLAAPGGPRFVERHPVSNMLVATDGSAFYVGLNPEGQPTGIVTKYVVVDGHVRRMAEARPPGTIRSLIASHGRVGAAVEAPGGSVAFEAFETGAPGSLVPSLVVPVPSVPVSLGRTSVLFQDVNDIIVWDITTMPAPAERGRWHRDEDRPDYTRIVWSAFDGPADDVLVLTEVKASNGDMIGHELFRLRQVDGAGLEVVNKEAAPSAFVAYGGGTTCFVPWMPTPGGELTYSQRNEGAFVCRTGDEPYRVLPAGEGWPDGEVETRYPKPVKAFEVDGTFYVASSGYTYRLTDDGAGKLRATWRAEETVASFIYSIFHLPTRTLIQHEGKLADLYDAGGTIGLRDTGIPAEGPHVTDPGLVIMNKSAAPEPRVELMLRDPETLAPLGSAVLPGSAEPNVVVNGGSHLYVHTAADTWLKVDLTVPSAPRLAGEFTWTWRSPFVARGTIAYTFENEQREGPEATLRLRLIDLAADPPRQIGVVDITDDVPVAHPGWHHWLYRFGDIVYVTRPTGWITRLDVRTPGAPVPLAPITVIAENVEMHGLRDHVAAVSSHGSEGQVLSLVGGAADADLGATRRWRGWKSGEIKKLNVVGRQLIVDNYDRIEHLRWMYDLSDAAHPAPLGNADYTITPLLAGADGILAVNTEDGGVTVWDVSQGHRMAPTAKWCLGNGRCPPPPGGPYVNALAVVRPVVYALGSDGRLSVLDVSTPGRTRLVGMHHMPVMGPLLVAGRRLLIGSTPPYQVDIAEPFSPRPIGPLAGVPEGLRPAGTSGTTAVYGGGRDVVFIDFAVPERPEVRAHLRLAEDFKTLHATDGWVYGYLDGAIWVVRVDGRIPPTVVGRLSVPPDGRMAALRDVVYFAHDQRIGVEVLTRFRPTTNLWLPVAFRPRR
ncbi:MAG: hypothetical protein IT332_02910 [Ardenticatenales bacterium]|nr:hypothetical protein [Ardenticatenales bacterium]